MSVGSVITIVLSPAASYDLVGLEPARDELSIAFSDTTDNSWLSRAIRQVSRAVMTETRRVFAPEYVQDAFDIRRSGVRVPAGPAALQLSRWPVLAVVSVEQTTLAGAVPVDPSEYQLDAVNGALYSVDPDTGAAGAWEPLPTTVKYSAGYGAVVTESHPVPASSPYTVTVGQAPVFSCDQTVTYANRTVLTPVAASPAQGQYSVAKGAYTFNSADAGLTLSFAYATLGLPDDLVEVGLRLINARYRSRNRDPNLIQQETLGVGTQRWWFGGAPGQTGQFPPDIQSVLDNYTVPTVA